MSAVGAAAQGVASELARGMKTLEEARPPPHLLMAEVTYARICAIGNALLRGYLKTPALKQNLFGLLRRSSTISHQTRRQSHKAEKKRRRQQQQLVTASSERTLLHSVEALPLDVEEGSLEGALERFHAVTLLYLVFLTTFAKTDRFVFHLAGMRRMYLDLKEMNLQLDAVVETAKQFDLVLEVVDDDETMNEMPAWLRQLDMKRDQEENDLSVKAAKNALPFTRNMKAHEPMEALTLLKYEIDFFRKGNTPLHVASMKKVFFSVVRSSNGRVSRIPDWYIPPYTVHYTREVLDGMKGSVGTAHRGRWINRKPVEGKEPPDKGDSVDVDVAVTYDVVVKRIDIHVDAIEVFRHEVEIWFELDHSHILKLYGASHCSSPALLICEDAKEGPITQFLTHFVPRSHGSPKFLRAKFGFQNFQHALWSLFVEAAEGLRFLHEDKKLVHGNLKCDNILVTGDHHVKLSDFGIGMLTLQNQAEQDKKFNEMGWRAPECRGKFGRPTFKSDVYSLGLCVLGALQTWPSKRHRNSVSGALSQSESQLPSQPRVGDVGFEPLDNINGLDTHVSDLVQRMCQKKPEGRARLDEVTAMMTKLRDQAARSSGECNIC